MLQTHGFSKNNGQEKNKKTYKCYTNNCTGKWMNETLAYNRYNNQKIAFGPHRFTCLCQNCKTYTRLYSQYKGSICRMAEL